MNELTAEDENITEYYKLSCTASNDPNGGRILETNVTELQVTLMDLQPNITNYTCCILAVTKIGNGSHACGSVELKQLEGTRVIPYNDKL